ncbi:MAG: acetate--CoA ligase family protein [Candidatus Hydrogenedentota bacterium]|nr:MAG: acetate--CoA ligase family protein [Candidatus Hydrogenedentota bacterium]
METITQALKAGQRTLSEYQSKQVLSAYGIPVTREFLAKDSAEAADFAEKLGYPVVLKGCSPELTHKTERQLIALKLRDGKEVAEAFDAITKRAGEPLDGILVQEMVPGSRELVAGLTRDEQFGPCAMLGLGGIFVEVLKQVTFRIAPLEERDAFEMMEELPGNKILDAFRGEPPVDRKALAQVLIAVGKIGLEHEAVKEIDVNPLIISGAKPVAVDALVVLGE